MDINLNINITMDNALATLLGSLQQAPPPKEPVADTPVTIELGKRIKRKNQSHIMQWVAIKDTIDRCVKRNEQFTHETLGIAVGDSNYATMAARVKKYCLCVGDDGYGIEKGVMPGEFNHKAPLLYTPWYKEGGKTTYATTIAKSTPTIKAAKANNRIVQRKQAQSEFMDLLIEA